MSRKQRTVIPLQIGFSMEHCFTPKIQLSLPVLVFCNGLLPCLNLNLIKDNWSEFQSSVVKPKPT